MGWDDITIPLRLRAVRVIGVLEDTLTRLKIEVRSGWSVSWCPSCGHKCSRVHDTRSRPVRDQMMTGRQVTLVWQRRRFVCDNCGNRHLEKHPEFEGNLTRRLARQVITDTRVMTISAVARREGLGWHKVMGLVTAWSNRIAEHRRRRRPCRVLLIDETSIQRGHKYVTVIKNGDTGKTLDIVEHRSAAALAGFLRSQPRSWRRKVKTVVTDGSRPYKKAVDAWLPHARHVLDRFHVVRWFAAGLNAVRRDVQRRPEGNTSVFDPEVSEPGSFSSAGPTGSPPTKPPASDNSSNGGPASGPPGTPSPSSTASTSPETTRPPSPRCAASPIYTPPVSSPNSTRLWKPSAPGKTKSSTGTGPDTRPTAASKEPTTSSRSSGEPPTDSPTPTTTQPEDSY